MNSGARSLPLLEREGEMAALGQALTDAVGGAGSVLVLRGAAGIGKTRLLGEARRLAVELKLRPLLARGGVVERDLPWGLVRQALDPALAELSAGVREEVFADAGGLARTVFGGQRPSGEGPIAVAGIIYGLYWVLVGLSARRPVALLVDDAHWADEESLRWLSFMAPRVEGLPVSVIIAVRSGDSDARREPLTEIAASTHATAVEPTPLTLAAAATLLQNLSAGSAVPSFVAACRDATGGNPFLLNELLRELEVERMAPTEANAGRVASLRSSTIVNSVLLRMARLPAEATAFARAVAVLGGGREIRDATALAEITPEAAGRAQGVLSATEILTPASKPEFVHPLVRGAIYEELSTLHRANWHMRAARILAASGAKTGEVVPHLLQTPPAADPWVRATLREGGSAALARGAPDLASRLLERARREAVGPESDPSLLLELGKADFAKRGAGGLKALEEALASTSDPQEMVTIALELGRALHALGNHPKAASMFGAVLGSLEAADPELQRLVQAHFIYTGLQDADSFEAAVGQLGKASEELGDGGPADDILRACLATVTAAGGGREAGELAEEALRDDWLIAERTPALGFAAAALMWSDELPRAADIWDRALREGRLAAERPWISFASCFRSQVAFRMGDLRDAEVHARDSLEVMNDWDLLPPDPAAFLCDSLVEQGLLDDAELVLAESGYDRALPMRQGYRILLASRARLNAARGHHELAVQDLRELGRRCDEQLILNPGAFAWRSALAESLMTVDPCEACDLADEELDRARAFGAPRAIGIALRVRGLLARGPDQVALLGEGVQVLESSHARLELARGRVELGGALRRLGRLLEAREALRQGLTDARSIGAGLVAMRAREELKAAGVRPRRDELRGRDVLTAAENRVARMAAEGLGNREIAQALFVSLRTIETHLTHTYQKLEITGRGQLPTALEAQGSGASDAKDRGRTTMHRRRP